MARSVLARLALAAVLLLPFVLAHAAEGPCPAPAGSETTQNTDLQALQEHTRSGPFYRELMRRFGKPLSCKFDSANGNLALTYTFRSKAQLVAKTNPGIEYNEQRLEVSGMSGEKAKALLKAAEKEAYKPDACGIAWDKPDSDGPGEAAGTREVIYRGDTCNCQARVIYRKKCVVTLILRSAC